MRSYFLIALAGLVIAGCDRPREMTSPSHSMTHSLAMQQAEASADVQSQVAQLRAVTARFQRFAAADSAGWDTRITDCFSDPTQGAMGFHYGNTDLIDGNVDPLNPELLLYEPQKNGTLKFVAVEYIVPFGAWTAAEPPRLYGLDFHRNEAFGLWILHVWHFRENPNGLFMDWNPKVSCQYATE